MVTALGGKRIFITGGTGFLGSLVLRSLRERAAHSKNGISVTVLSRNPEAFKKSRPELLWPGLTFLKGDVESFRFEPGSSFDYILHGGNPSDPPGDEAAAQKFWQTVVEGTRHLLTEIDRLEKVPARILLLSSGAIYGPQPADVATVSEDASTRAGSPYADAKLAAEKVMTEFTEKRGIAFTIGRIFACAGAYLPLQGRFALGQFIRAARDEGVIRIRGDGKTKRSYLAGDELAQWLLTLLVSKGTGTEVFNIGSADALTIWDIAEAVRGCFSSRGKTVSLFLEPSPTAANSPDYIPDIQRIADKYGLKPVKSSLDAIRETVEWVLNES